MNTELYAALCEAGASPEKATAAASVTPSAERVASREDTAVVMAELRAIRWYFAIMLAGLALVIGVLFQQQSDLGNLRAAVGGLQMSVDNLQTTVDNLQASVGNLESAAQANANSINALKVAVERSASAELSP